jgi:hypothetical protein
VERSELASTGALAAAGSEGAARGALRAFANGFSDGSSYSSPMIETILQPSKLAFALFQLG